jgi:hypothetical protein
MVANGSSLDEPGEFLIVLMVALPPTRDNGDMYTGAHGESNDVVMG